MKKRLLGAAVLIALAVIFVPMLLPSPSGSGVQSPDMNIPPQPGGELQTRVLQVGPNGASAGSSTAARVADPDHVATLELGHRPNTAASAAPAIEPTTGPVASALPQAPAPATSAPDVANAAPASAPPAASSKPEPVAGGVGAAAGAQYTVNLGIYADHASADQLVAQARQQGFTAHATPETFQHKQVLRVRVGPFHSRAEAEAARLQLKGFEHVSSMTVDTAAVNQTGDAPASALPASQPGGWAVQLAAYSDQISADKLRDRLRGQGFDGYVDSVTTSKGKLWRVRAGPYASRDVAATTRGQIAQKLNIKGNIVTE